MGLFGSLALLADFFFRRRRLKERERKEGEEKGRGQKGEKDCGIAVNDTSEIFNK